MHSLEKLSQAAAAWMFALLLTACGEPKTAPVPTAVAIGSTAAATVPTAAATVPTTAATVPTTAATVDTSAATVDTAANTVDFERVAWYARRAQAAYQPEAEIRAQFPHTVLVGTTDGDVQYFLERDTVHKRQIIAVRGTANWANALEDAHYAEFLNPELGVYVHRGFSEDTQAVLAALLPHLERSQPVIVTGHSLGAAVATLLMMNLHERGFILGESINFGQPKVTNKPGAQRFQFLPLVRVVDEDDVVPLVPADDLIDAAHDGFEHFGAEVILLRGRYYVFEDRHRARRLSAGSFWRNLGDESVQAHFLAHYLHNIQSKLGGATQVAYSERSRYTDL